MKKLGTIIFFTIIFLLLFLNINVHAKEGVVTIYYNDINQHPVGQKVSRATCTIGTTYKGTAPSISGYRLDVNASETSTYCDEGENIIAFVYQTTGNSKEGTVNVSCYDTKGNKLSKCTDGRSGTPGAEYYINPPTIDGYKFVRVEGPNNGKFKEGAINVKFIFESTGGNLVEEKKEQEPTPEVVTKKEEKPVSSTNNSTKTNNNNTVTTKKIVTKTTTVASSKEEKKEVVKEEVKEQKQDTNNKPVRTVTIVDHTKNNTSKYFVIGSIISSIALVGFVLKNSLFK